MEYPFKDLMPLDEATARDGYYKDWTHLDPEVFYSLTQISEYIKTKGYGVDVRLLIAQLAEHFGLKTTQVVDLANLLSTKHDALKDQFDVVIRDATSGADWGGEIVLARGGKATLGQRLDETTAQLDHARRISISIEDFPYNAKSGEDIRIKLNQAITDLSEAGGGVINIPPKEYHISLNETNQGIILKSNVNIIMHKNTIMRLIPTSSEAYHIFYISSVRNIKIYGGSIIGDKHSHLGTTGEWGFGISIQGAENIEVTNTKISECWGDGIYLGKSSTGLSKNILIDLVDCDDNRRQGLSLISGDTIRVRKSSFRNTEGTSPNAGIDIEPNNDDDVLRKISIEDCYTEKNKGGGVVVDLNSYSNMAEPFDITINNHYDDNSFANIMIREKRNDIKGWVKVLNPYLVNGRTNGMLITNWGSEGARITIDNPYIINCNESSNASESFGSAILINRGSANTGSEYIGGVDIINPTIVETLLLPKMKHNIFVRDSNHDNYQVKNVSIQNPIELVKDQYGRGKVVFSGGLGCSVSDENEQMTRSLKSASLTLNSLNFCKKANNLETIADRSVTLADELPIGTEFELNVLEDVYTALIPPATDTIYPIKELAGVKVSSSKTGSSIRVKKISLNKWVVTNMIGEWN